MELSELLLHIFPGGHVNCQRTYFDVNGLAASTVPLNCEVLASGRRQGPLGERRDYYLVRSAGVMLFFRIYSARAGCGYAEFASGSGVAVTPEEQRRLEALARQTISIVCSGPAAT